jgi:hypothetical protein
VGYGRYSSRAAYAELGALYQLLADYQNFFQPLQKLIAKQRAGAKVVKRYDRAQTPYQRLRGSGVLDEATEQALETRYQQLNPVRLRAEIEQSLERLWPLAEGRRR